MSDARLERNRFCARGPEECSGIAEPEEDGEVRYWKCAECGFEFGYQVVAAEGNNCQLGISVEGLQELENEKFRAAVLPFEAPQGFSLAHLAADPEFQRRLNEANSQVQLPGERGTTVFLGSMIRRRAE